MKKVLAIVLALMFAFVFAACGGDTGTKSQPPSSSSPTGDSTEPPASATESQTPVSSEEPASQPEESSEPAREYFDFTLAAKSIKVNGTIGGEDIVIITDNDHVAASNCKWTINVILKETGTANLYEVVSVTTGSGTVPDITLEEGQILFGVHSSSSLMDKIDEYQNVPGKLAAMALAAGDLIAVVGIEENDIQTLKEYKEGDNLEYLRELPSNLSNFVSFGAGVTTAVGPNDNTSILLTKIDKAPSYGDSALYTYEWGTTLGDYDWADFAILVVKYDHTVFGYVEDAIYGVDSAAAKKDIAMPLDGFILAVSKDNAPLFKKLDNIKSGNKFFVHGVQVTPVNYSISEATTAPVIDGQIGLTEWSGFLIDSVDETNELWDYSQFEKNNYGITAEIYAAYDQDNFYFAVVVDTPDHYNSVTSSNPGEMYKYCCIQVDIIDQSPLSEYMLANYDHIVNDKAVGEGHVRQYGFCVNGDSETISHVWMGTGGFTGTAKVLRDAESEKTIYEISVPWSEIGIEVVEAGAEIGLSVSINSTNKTEADADKWKNIKLRDGGGIILRNDWAKTPVATLN